MLFAAVMRPVGVPYKVDLVLSEEIHADAEGNVCTPFQKIGFVSEGHIQGYQGPFDWGYGDS